MPREISSPPHSGKPCMVSDTFGRAFASARDIAVFLAAGINADNGPPTRRAAVTVSLRDIRVEASHTMFQHRGDGQTREPGFTDARPTGGVVFRASTRR